MADEISDWQARKSLSEEANRAIARAVAAEDEAHELRGQVAFWEEQHKRRIEERDGAEARGRQRGHTEMIEALRDEQRWLAFLQANDEALYDEDNLLAAAYLDSITKEGDRDGG